MNEYQHIINIYVNLLYLSILLSFVLLNLHFFDDYIYNAEMIHSSEFLYYLFR